MPKDQTSDPSRFAPPAGPEEQPMRAALAGWEQFGRALPHELRGPLAMIDAFATLLEGEAQALSPRGRRWLDSLRAASLHAKSLGDALLMLAPVPMLAMESVPVDLSALAAQIMAVERASAPGRQAQVAIEPGLLARGDPHLLRTLLGNLLGNAWKYSATREQARIAFGRVIAADGAPAFCVSDNGVGFSMEYASKLFLPFERLHTRTEFEGVGLGLCIALRVVERHGGRIWVEAAPDQGARVFFRLGAAEPAR